LHGESADVVRFSGVGEVEVLFVGREAKAVGFVEILGDGGDFAGGGLTDSRNLVF